MFPVKAGRRILGHALLLKLLRYRLEPH